MRSSPNGLLSNLCQKGRMLLTDPFPFAVFYLQIKVFL
jgi:hypothetical protein